MSLYLDTMNSFNNEENLKYLLATAQVSREDFIQLSKNQGWLPSEHQQVKTTLDKLIFCTCDIAGIIRPNVPVGMLAVNIVAFVARCNWLPIASLYHNAGKSMVQSVEGFENFASGLHRDVIIEWCDKFARGSTGDLYALRKELAESFEVPLSPAAKIEATKPKKKN